MVGVLLLSLFERPSGPWSYELYYHRLRAVAGEVRSAGLPFADEADDVASIVDDAGLSGVVPTFACGVKEMFLASIGVVGLAGEPGFEGEWSAVDPLEEASMSSSVAPSQRLAPWV